MRIFLRYYLAHAVGRVRAMSSKAQGAIQSGFGAVLNHDQGAETVSTADLLQAMSLVQHELEEAEVRTDMHTLSSHFGRGRCIQVWLLKILLYAMYG